MTRSTPLDTLSRSIHSPFVRLRRLLDGLEPGGEVIDLTVGEPKHAMPPFVMEVMGKAAAGFGKYPPMSGTPELVQAISAWLGRRYGLPRAIDPATEIHPLCGSREGLFSAVFPTIDRRPPLGRPAVLMPNPFYQAYLAAALAAGAEPVYLDATARSGFLPDLEALAARGDVLARTAAFYLCSPANPQGAVASADYLETVIRLARAHDFILFVDECYSEIYPAEPPPGGLEVALQRTGSLDNVVVFNSLSKRSNLPGLRSGFCAGDAAFIARLSQFRNVSGPMLPLPVQAVSTACWQDESHVEQNRRLYAEKFELAARMLGNRFGRVCPDGGFFLWLDTSAWGGGEATAVTLWKRCGVKVLPGAYLTQGQRQHDDPGSAYVRVALVQDPATTERALEQLNLVLA